MSWVCPNCSTSNDDENASCFVCGMERLTSLVDSTPDKSDTDDSRFVFSGFEAFKEFVKKMFRRKSGNISLPEIDEKRTIQPDKPSKTGRKKTKESKTRIVKLFDSDFSKPWPEHKIEFDLDAIRSKEYVRSEQARMGDIKGYKFFKKDGSAQFIRVEMLLVQKLAYKV